MPNQNRSRSSRRKTKGRKVRQARQVRMRQNDDEIVSDAVRVPPVENHVVNLATMREYSGRANCGDVRKEDTEDVKEKKKTMKEKLKERKRIARNCSLCNAAGGKIEIGMKKNDMKKDGVDVNAADSVAKEPYNAVQYMGSDMSNCRISFLESDNTVAKCPRRPCYLCDYSR